MWPKLARLIAQLRNLNGILLHRKIREFLERLVVDQGYSSVAAKVMESRAPEDTLACPGALATVTQVSVQWPWWPCSVYVLWCHYHHQRCSHLCFATICSCKLFACSSSAHSLLQGAISVFKYVFYKYPFCWILWKFHFCCLEPRNLTDPCDFGGKFQKVVETHKEEIML